MSSSLSRPNLKPHENRYLAWDSNNQALPPPSPRSAFERPRSAQGEREFNKSSVIACYEKVHAKNIKCSKIVKEIPVIGSFLNSLLKCTSGICEIAANALGGTLACTESLIFCCGSVITLPTLLGGEGACSKAQYVLAKQSAVVTCVALSSIVENIGFGSAQCLCSSCYGHEIYVIDKRYMQSMTPCIRLLGTSKNQKQRDIVDSVNKNGFVVLVKVLAGTEKFKRQMRHAQQPTQANINEFPEEFTITQPNKNLVIAVSPPKMETESAQIQKIKNTSRNSTITKNFSDDCAPQTTENPQIIDQSLTATPPTSSDSSTNSFKSDVVNNGISL